MKLLAIVNGASAGGRSGKRWPQVERTLRAAGIEVEAAFTERRGHAIELVTEALASGHRQLASFGGDGTLSEVVNGLVDEHGEVRAADAKLAILPSGTGGDFRRTLSIPGDLGAAVQLIVSGRTRRLDAGIIEHTDGTTRRFVNIASAGVGYEVDRRVNALKVKPGRLAYAWVSLRATLGYKSVPARVSVDGTEVSGRYFSIAFANGQYFGGGMHVAPEADPADGQLDVVLSETSGLRAVLQSRHLYAGTHLKLDGVTQLRGREIELTPEPGHKMGFDVDGEPLGFAPAKIRALPGVLNVYC
jgi:YegS/Rv2252/BmrU family lipid kinase